MSLADVLEHGLAMVRERAAAHGISLRLDIAGDIGMVWADELKLKQVVLNLLTNAVKFTPDGGSVEIAARVTDGEVEVTVTRHRHRHPRGRARADLRGLPARRARRARRAPRAPASA